MDFDSSKVWILERSRAAFKQADCETGLPADRADFGLDVSGSELNILAGQWITFSRFKPFWIFLWGYVFPSINKNRWNKVNLFFPVELRRSERASFFRTFDGNVNVC